jgi:CubicO group peptidase (beta-lactamase class C family)
LAEFAQNGKANITLRHVLSHQTGLFDIRNLIDSATEMLDWQHMLEVVAGATPRFAAGQSYAYQPLTYGWILGGVVEKLLNNYIG